MDDSDRKDDRFSIEIHSADWALINCFRALCRFCRDGGNIQISREGDGQMEWRRNGHKMKFHFKSPDEREEFVCQANRLFPKELWEKIEEKDNDPRPEE